ARPARPAGRRRHPARPHRLRGTRGQPAVPQGIRGSLADRARDVQPADRRAACAVRAHRGNPRPQHPGQARLLHPHRDRHLVAASRRPIAIPPNSRRHHDRVSPWWSRPVMGRALPIWGVPLKIRTVFAAAGAVALLGAGALVLPAVASASSATHTLKFISVQKSSVMFTKTTGANQDTDVNAKGKAIGFDMIYFAATSAT